MSCITKILFAFTVCFGLDLCSSLDPVFLSPYYVLSALDSGWNVCAENKRNQSEYNELKESTHDCFFNMSNTNESICHNVETNIQKCFGPVVDFYVDCLPEKSKDLPPAIAKGVVSTVDAFCTSSGEMLLEILNQCFYDYDRYKNIKEQCKKEALENKLKQINMDEVPSKSEFCLVFRELGDCWQEYVNQECGSLVARKVFARFYGAALAACRT